MKSRAPVGYTLVGAIVFYLLVEALVFSLLLFLPELLIDFGGLG
jgi:hypothetical protein